MPADNPDQDRPSGVPAREQKPEDASVVSDLSADLDQPQAPSSEQPAERQRVIRKRRSGSRSRSRSHWNLHDPEDDGRPAKQSKGGWYFGLTCLVLTTVLGLLLIATGSLAGFSRGSSGPPRALLFALNALEQGDLNGARMFIANTPPELHADPYFLSLATRLAIALKDPARAKHFLDQALAQAPEDPLTHIAHAEFLLAAGEPEKSIATVQKALAIDNELNIAWRVLAAGQSATGNTAEALTSIGRSLELAPMSVSSITTAVQLHLQNNDSDEADRLFRTTLQEYKIPEIAIAYAGFQRQRGDTEAAAETLDTALRSNPRHPQLTVYRARLFLTEDNLPAAIELFKEAASLESHDPERWSELGTAYSKDERYLDAESAFRKAVEITPEDPSALNNLGYTLVLQKEYAKAEPVLLKAAEIEPNHLYVQQNLARLYNETLRNDLAAEAEKRAAEIRKLIQEQQQPQPDTAPPSPDAGAPQ